MTQIQPSVATIRPGKLWGLGLGPGDPELITLKAYRVLQAASVVAYPCAESGVSVARSQVSEYLQPHQQELPFSLPFNLTESANSAYDRAAAAIRSHLLQGQDVVVLCEGDAFFYGTFMYLFQRLAPEFSTEVIPGVSSVIAGAACLGTPLTYRNDAFVVLSAILSAADLELKLAIADAAVIIKLGRHFRKVYRVLEQLQLAQRCHYIEYATGVNQRILSLEDVDPDQVPYFSMIVLPSLGQNPAVASS